MWTDGMNGALARSFIRSAEGAMTLTDPRLPDNPCIDVNDAFCALTGYRRDEIVGRNFRFLQGPGTPRGPVDTLRHGLAERRSVITEVLNYRRDGTQFVNAILVSPVHEAGELAYFVGSQIEVPQSPLAQRSAEAARRLATLSAREETVIDLLSRGLSSKAIALALQLSPRTVEMHRARLMRKLGVGTLAEALRVMFDAERGREAAAVPPPQSPASRRIEAARAIVLDAERRIANQRCLLAQVVMTGRFDAGAAREMLEVFETTMDLMRDSLKAMIALTGDDARLDETAVAAAPPRVRSAR